MNILLVQDQVRVVNFEVPKYITQHKYYPFMHKK